MTITPAQCLAGREALGWSAAGLASKARIHPRTVGNFESGLRTPYAETLAAIERAMRAAGVEFVAGDEGGTEIRLRRA
jgi:transcriptional regulator with XRE-family HTH domain